MASHTLSVRDELYKKVNALAVKETVRRGKPITWSRLAIEILEKHIQKQK